MDKEYEEKFGHLSNIKEEILIYLENNLNLNKDKIMEEENRINKLEWKKINILLPIIPKPTPRPRYQFKSKHFYVKGAQQNKKIIKEYIDDLGVIFTRTKLLVKTYQLSPSSMTNTELYLAEKGIICPIQDPDWDNLGKAYSDMLQGILLINDNIIQIGTVEKYFSIKPRVELFLEYQDGFDCKFNKRKVENSTAYKNLILDTVEYEYAT